MLFQPYKVFSIIMALVIMGNLNSGRASGYKIRKRQVETLYWNIERGNQRGLDWLSRNHPWLKYNWTASLTIYSAGRDWIFFFLGFYQSHVAYQSACIYLSLDHMQMNVCSSVEK